MNINQIKLITCPYCENTFKKNIIVKIKGKVIEYGSVYCQCDEFPIIEGILLLDKKKAKPVLEFIKKKDTKNALIKSILPFKKNYIYKLIKFEKISRFILTILLNKNKLENPRTLKFLLTLLTTKEEARYHLNRKKEYDSLLIFFPTLLLEKNQTLQWLNLGSGLMNYYSKIHNHFSKKILFISVEQSFISLFFSNFFNKKNKNVIKICTNSSIGKLTKNKNDIVTMIDMIPFLENQRNQIEVAENSLKKDGLLYISGLMEHMYLPPNSHCFPLLIDTVQSFFSKKTIIINEAKLLHQIENNSIFIKDTIKKEDDKISKYSVLITPQEIAKTKKQTLSKKITKEAQYYYGDDPQSFTNKVY